MEDETGSVENMSEVQILPASPEDVLEIEQVLRETWLHTYPNAEAGITTQQIEQRFQRRLAEESLGRRREEIAKNPQDRKTFVAKAGDKIVGVCRVIKRHDRNQLSAFYVLPGYQGKGTGSKLWQEAKSFLGQDKDIFLHVADYNTKAIAVYKKLGFRETDIRIKDNDLDVGENVDIPEMEMVLTVKK